MDDKRYGVIAEFKDDGPLILESKPLDGEAAYKRMQALRGDPNVIRVAVF